MSKVGGYRKDTPSPKDWPFEKMGLVASASTSTHVIQEKTPVSDQGNLNSCVGNATCDALEILLGVEGIDIVQLSRLYLYWEARQIDGTTSEDEGTYISSAFRAMTTLGVCPESMFPYDEDKVFTAPPVSALLDGNANKITGYYRIPTNSAASDSIEAAIRSNHPVVFGAPVDNKFLDVVGDVVIGPPDMQDLAGGHAMILVGVRYIGGKRQFLVRNSWGTGWGNNGHVWLEESYVPFMDDIWVPTRVRAIV